MSGPGSPDVVECPNCGHRSPVGTNRCPECRYPLVLVAPTPRDPVDPDLFVKPGEDPHADPTTTAHLPVAGPVTTGGTSPGIFPPVASTGSMTCPRCRRLNAPTRERWCEWCGADMVPPPPPPATHAPLGPRAPRPWRRMVLVSLLTLGVLVGVPAGAVVVLQALRAPAADPSESSSAEPTGDPTSPTQTDTATPTQDPAAVDPSRITAVASSTADSGSGRYSIANTLDGLDSTAWNSNGARDGQVGLTLVYTFDTPVDVRRIDVLNGYVRNPEGDPSVYSRNARLREVVVRTDETQTRWTLDDRPTLQSLEAELGTTRSVTLEVVSVYEGTGFLDVALTEIAFTGVG